MKSETRTIIFLIFIIIIVYLLLYIWMIIFKQRNSLTSQTKSNHQYVSVEEGNQISYKPVNKYLPSLWIIISMIRSRPRAQKLKKIIEIRWNNYSTDHISR